MTLEQWLGMVGGLALVAFIVFAFRQGLRVKPDRNNRDHHERHWPGNWSPDIYDHHS
jgi:hypothetical protein